MTVPLAFEAGPSRSASPDQPWYRRPAADTRKETPYTLCHLAIQEDDQRYRTARHVCFWPFTSPTDTEISEWAWDDMEGVFAIAAEQRIIVGRVTDADGYEELWSFETGDHHRWHVEWSYDPVSLRPVLAAAGESDMIYLFDHQLKAPYRILPGHGHHIHCLKFHPRMPHILASASGDKTIRIWNILGTDLPPSRPGELRSQNYSQGMADEGNVIVAILAGESAGGHRYGVKTIAFHPTQNALVSGGSDRHVKIWRLPRLPDPTLLPLPTPEGYRPEIVCSPLFSTDTIHTDALVSVEWLCPDVILSRSAKETVAWQWTRYPQWFSEDDNDEIEETSVPAPDSIRSQNYRVCADLSIELGSRSGSSSMSIHEAFDPSEDEIDFATTDLVIDNLIAFPIRSQAPSIAISNPDHWVSAPVPFPHDEGYQRPPTPDYVGSPTHPVEDELGDEAMPFVIDSEDDENAGLTAGEVAEGVETGLGMKSKVVGDDTDIEDNLDTRSNASGLNGGPGTKEARVEKTPEAHKSDRLWRLRVPHDMWRELTDTAGQQTRTESREDPMIESADGNSVLRSVAFSPRGAQWVIAVGDFETIAIWRLPPKSGML